MTNNNNDNNDNDKRQEIQHYVSAIRNACAGYAFVRVSRTHAYRRPALVHAQACLRYIHPTSGATSRQAMHSHDSVTGLAQSWPSRYIASVGAAPQRIGDLK